MPVNIFTTIDDPLAAHSTDAFGINDSGQIVGTFGTSNVFLHGFVLRGGSFVTIDDPVQTQFSTEVLAINDAGQIVGHYRDAGGLHGVLLTGNIFIPIDDPLASPSQGTSAFGINDAGQIVGTFKDATSTTHGFLRSNGGAFSTLDHPSAGIGAGLGTFASGINEAGQIVGSYTDKDLRTHGFLRDPPGSGGVFKTLDDPLATQGTVARGINDASQIVGAFLTFDNPTSTSVSHGFLLTAAHTSPLTIRRPPRPARLRLSAPVAQACICLVLQSHGALLLRELDGGVK
jgi:probable HAF family extracellular repeat protein